MKIQIVGPGCPRCQEAERNVFNACAVPILAVILTLIAAGIFFALGIYILFLAQ